MENTEIPVIRPLFTFSVEADPDEDGVIAFNAGGRATPAQIVNMLGLSIKQLKEKFNLA